MRHEAPIILAPRSSAWTGMGARAVGHRRIVLALAGTGLAAMLGMALGVYWDNQVMVYSMAFLALVLPVLWHRPQLAAYLLVAGAALFESFHLRYPDSLTDRVPLFHTLAMLDSPVGLPLTLAEILVVMTVGTVCLKRIAERQTPLAAGPLFWPLALFLLMVSAGILHGLATGGDLRTTVWETRALFLLGLAYVLAYNIFTDRGQIRLLFWLLIAAIAVKGLLGTWRFLVTLEGDLGRISSLPLNTNSLMAHEESFLFALLIVVAAVFFLSKAGGGQMTLALLAMPPVFLAFLANERRLGMIVLALGLLVVAAAAFLLWPHRRKLVILPALLALLAVPPYVAAFGQNGGLIGQPARAVISLYAPDPRDESSNVARVLETDNLKLNIRDAPLFGHGFGKPVTHHLPIADLSDFFGLWEFIPHNTILWVWFRLGLIGFVIFWFVVGKSLLISASAAKRTEDPYLGSIAIVIGAAILMWIVWSAGDMGLTNVRLAILMGTLMAIGARVAHLGAPSGTERLTDAGVKGGHH